MITLEDLKRQRILTLRQAAALIGHYTGWKPSVSTCWRWALKGVRGSKLAAVRIGGKVYTTEPAVMSFIATLSADVKSVKTEVTETVCPPRDSSQATASEGLHLAKQHLNQALGRETRAEDNGKP